MRIVKFVAEEKFLGEDQDVLGHYDLYVNPDSVSHFIPADETPDRTLVYLKTPPVFVEKNGTSREVSSNLHIICESAESAFVKLNEAMSQSRN